VINKSVLCRVFNCCNCNNEIRKRASLHVLNLISCLRVCETVRVRVHTIGAVSKTSNFRYQISACNKRVNRRDLAMAIFF